jgi:molybdate transport system permease protein
VSEVDPFTAVRLSLLVAACATLLGLPIAIALGWLLARREFPGKALVSGALLTPLVLPPVITGLLLLRILGRNGTLGRWLASHGLPIPFTFGAAVIAAFVVGLPLFVMVARSTFDALDPRYEEVSLTLGIRPARTFLRVTLPLALPGLAAAAVLSFARALGEFGATAVLAGNMEGRTRTISLAVYTLLDLPDGESSAWTLVLASGAIAVLALIGYEALLRWQKRRLDVGVGR